MAIAISIWLVCMLLASVCALVCIICIYQSILLLYLHDSFCAHASDVVNAVIIRRESFVGRSDTHRTTPKNTTTPPPPPTEYVAFVCFMCVLCCAPESKAALSLYYNTMCIARTYGGICISPRFVCTLDERRRICDILHTRTRVLRNSQSKHDWFEWVRIYICIQFTFMWVVW